MPDWIALDVAPVLTGLIIGAAISMVIFAALYDRWSVLGCSLLSVFMIFALLVGFGALRAHELNVLKQDRQRHGRAILRCKHVSVVVNEKTWVARGCGRLVVFERREGVGCSAGKSVVLMTKDATN